MTVKNQRKRNATNHWYRKQEGICALCGFKMLKPVGPGQAAGPFNATFDHIKFKCSGGGIANNGRAVHLCCNWYRGSTDKHTKEDYVNSFIQKKDEISSFLKGIDN